MQHSFETLIVGGGVTGLAVGYGLAKRGRSVAVIDATALLDRASRSNMGLIWCQSKALGCREYVRWGFQSSRLFGEFAGELKENSGIDPLYSASGGIIPCLGEKEYQQRSNYLDALHAEAGGEGYPGTMVSRSELEKMLPRIQFGPQVCGGTWCAEDGYVDPLHLLFALRRGLTNLGGTLITGCRVTGVAAAGSGYKVQTPQGEFECERVVLAGGLGNRQIGASLGVKVPVTPNRGQVFLTERIGDILPIPLLGIARTGGGTVMVGFQHEEVGLDPGFSPEMISDVARWAVAVWPAMARLRVIRCWSCLRIFPNDGYPIYDRVPGHDKAFILNAHSAVTLAAVHEKTLPEYVLGRELPPDGAAFGLSRFGRA